MKWSKIMTLHIVVLFATMTFAQADFFEVDAKPTFDNTITWVSFSDVVAVDIKGQKVFWDVILYRESFTDPDSIGGLIHFQILLNKRIEMEFPSQALPLKNLKDKMKDESAVQLGLVYTGKEQ